MESLICPEILEGWWSIALPLQEIRLLSLCSWICLTKKGIGQEGLYIQRSNNFLHINACVQIFKKFCASSPWKFSVNLLLKFNFSLKQSFSFTSDASWSLNVSAYSVVMTNAFDHNSQGLLERMSPSTKCPLILLLLDSPHAFIKLIHLCLKLILLPLPKMWNRIRYFLVLWILQSVFIMMSLRQS